MICLGMFRSFYSWLGQVHATAEAKEPWPAGQEIVRNKDRSRSKLTGSPRTSLCVMTLSQSGTTGMNGSPALPRGVYILNSLPLNSSRFSYVSLLCYAKQLCQLFSSQEPPWQEGKNRSWGPRAQFVQRNLSDLWSRVVDLHGWDDPPSINRNWFTELLSFFDWGAPGERDFSDSDHPSHSQTLEEMKKTRWCEFSCDLWSM